MFAPHRTNVDSKELANAWGISFVIVIALCALDDSLSAPNEDRRGRRSLQFTPRFPALGGGEKDAFKKFLYTIHLAASAKDFRQCISCVHRNHVHF